MASLPLLPPAEDPRPAFFGGDAGVGAKEEEAAAALAAAPLLVETVATTSGTGGYGISEGPRP